MEKYFSILLHQKVASSHQIALSLSLCAKRRIKMNSCYMY